MASKAYLGADSIAHKIKKAYIGVNGVARKVKKAYIGDANGVARKIFSSGKWMWYTGVNYAGYVREGDQVSVSEYDSSTSTSLWYASTYHTRRMACTWNGKIWRIYNANLQYSTDGEEWTSINVIPPNATYLVAIIPCNNYLGLILYLYTDGVTSRGIRFAKLDKSLNYTYSGTCYLIPDSISGFVSYGDYIFWTRYWYDSESSVYFQDYLRMDLSSFIATKMSSTSTTNPDHYRMIQGTSNNVYVSLNGSYYRFGYINTSGTWTYIAMLMNYIGSFYWGIHFKGKYFLYGSKGTYISSDGVNWTLDSSTSGGTVPWTSLAAYSSSGNTALENADVYYAAAYNGFAYTTDGITWTAVAEGSSSDAISWAIPID